MNNLMTRNGLRIAKFFTLIAGLTITASCKKTPVATPAQTPVAPVSLPMPSSHRAEAVKPPVPAVKDTAMDRTLEERYPGNPAEQEALRSTMRQLDALGDAEARLAEIHRRTMVTPAPADFKPEPVARKIRLKLILEKPTIRIGGELRFRLEMTNVGRDKIDYSETSASVFVKDGSMLDSSTIRYYLTDSRKNRKKLLSRRVRRSSRSESRANEPDSPPSGLSATEMEKWFRETNAMGQAHATFKVKLLPGETLHSIGDDDSPVENFKTLNTNEKFDKPGTYQIQVELDDRPRPLSKGYIEAVLEAGKNLEEIHNDHERWMRDALGPAASNSVSFEVVR